MNKQLELLSSYRRSIRISYTHASGNKAYAVISSYKRTFNGKTSAYGREIGKGMVYVIWATGEERMYYAMDLVNMICNLDADVDDRIVNEIYRISKEGRRSRLSLLALRSIHEDEMNVRRRVSSM